MEPERCTVATVARRGEFCFGEAWAAYRGPTAEHTAHAHAAIQIAIGDDALSVIAADGHVTSGCAILVRPMVRHVTIAAGAHLSLLYVEPQSPMASAVLRLAGPKDIVQLPDEIAQSMDFSGSPAQWFAKLERLVPASAEVLDPRLSTALGLLAGEPGAITIADAAGHCGLSVSRLRALARRELGLPLCTWLIWRKLERAARALTSGASLSEAALRGGFSDQAHFARSMRRMFGVTPSMATDTLT